MSSDGRDFDCGEAANAAPYVLGSLEQVELERYREHLDTCARCRAEVGELRLVANELPATAPIVRAPEQLRSRILATVRAEAELLSAAGSQADEPPGRASRASGWWARPFAIGGVALAAVVVLALAIVLGGGSSARERVIQASVPIRGASAMLRQRDGRAVLSVAGMPQPAGGKIYEVWLSRRGREPQPTDALFGVTRSGDGAVAVPGNLHGVREVLVTSEPVGGSLHPTSPPVLRVLVST